MTSIGPCELADAQGVRVGDCDVELVHEGYKLELVASRGFDTDRGLGLPCQVLQIPESFDAVVDFRCRRTASYLLRRDVYVELLLRNIHANVH